MIKLIASDIDGTLVQDGDSNLNEEYYNVIRKLKEQGIIFAAASGRQYPSIAKLFAPIHDDIIFIAENGAFIYCRDHEMFSDRMDSKLIHELIHDIRRLDDCEILLNGKYTAYTESENKEFLDWMLNSYHYELKQVHDLLTISEEIIKVSIFNKTDATAVAKEWFLPKWSKRIQAVCAGVEWIDCMNEKVNKGAALKTIQTALNISPDETMTFGDNLNDIEMLKQATHSYAIGNARDEVKAVATHVADTNLNHGVLKILKTLIH